MTRSGVWVGLQSVWRSWEGPSSREGWTWREPGGGGCSHWGGHRRISFVWRGTTGWESEVVQRVYGEEWRGVHERCFLVSVVTVPNKHYRAVKRSGLSPGSGPWSWIRGLLDLDEGKVGVEDTGDRAEGTGSPFLDVTSLDPSGTKTDVSPTLGLGRWGQGPRSGTGWRTGRSGGGEGRGVEGWCALRHV